MSQGKKECTLRANGMIYTNSRAVGYIDNEGNVKDMLGNIAGFIVQGFADHSFIYLGNTPRFSVKINDGGGPDLGAGSVSQWERQAAYLREQNEKFSRIRANL
jgi:hypothetical protein